MAAEHVAAACPRPRPAGRARRRAGRGSARGSCRRGSRGPGSRASPPPAGSAARAMLPDLGLGELAEGEAQAGEQLRPQRRRACRSGPCAGRRRAPAAAPRRRERRARSGRSRARRAEAVGERQHRVEAHHAVAAHAGVGRAPARVLGDVVVDDARRGSCSSRSSVRCGRPMRVGERARVEDRLGRAAAALPSPAGSAHSLSVTATTSWPPRARAARRRRCRRRRSTPTRTRSGAGSAVTAAAQTPRALGAGRPRRGRPRGACRATGRPARLRSSADPTARPRARCSPRQAHAGAAGRDGRAAALGVEGDLRRAGRRRRAARPAPRRRRREPPALPTTAPSGTGPRPCGSVRCCAKGCTPRSLDRPPRRTMLNRLRYEQGTQRVPAAVRTAAPVPTGFRATSTCAERRSRRTG